MKAMITLRSVSAKSPNDDELYRGSPYEHQFTAPVDQFANIFLSYEIVKPNAPVDDLAIGFGQVPNVSLILFPPANDIEL
jgi:hypothetical protein